MGTHCSRVCELLGRKRHGEAAIELRSSVVELACGGTFSTGTVFCPNKHPLEDAAGSTTSFFRDDDDDCDLCGKAIGGPNPVWHTCRICAYNICPICFTKQLVQLRDRKLGKRAVLGPIIGLVTGTTARVLYEFNFEGSVTSTVKEMHGTTTTECTRECKAGIPVAFEFHGLELNTRYEVFLPDEIDCSVSYEVLKGSFRTIGGDLKERPFTMALLSCNKAQVVRSLSARRKAGQVEFIDLWDDLAFRCGNGEIDVILHNGDQIYADEIDQGIEGGDPDSTYARALRWLHKKKSMRWLTREMWESEGLKEQLTRECRIDGTTQVAFVGTQKPRHKWESKRDIIVDAYREMYRETWGLPATRRALANASNLMMYDDHDISDDWGDKWFQRKPAPGEEATPEFWVGTLGLQVVHEYQRQLREDVVVGQPIKEFDNEGFVQRWGDVALMMVDMRGPRSFRCPDKYLVDKKSDPPLICEEQWEMIEKFLQPKGGPWDDVKYVMFTTPVPPVLFSSTLTQIGSRFVNDCSGQFAFGQSDSLVRLMNVLARWKVADKTREIAIYAGDIHVGKHTDITKDGILIRQMIASSIGNHGADWKGQATVKFLGWLQQDVGDGWYFSHHHHVETDRNYGIARASWPNPSAQVVVKHAHVTSHMKKDGKASYVEI